MMLSAFFVDALKLLFRKPKLFVPKLLVAALFGAGMLLTARLTISVFAPLPAAEMQGVFLLAIFLLLYTIAVSVIDIIVNAMYPVMVKNHLEGKQISLSKSFQFALRKAKTIIPAEFSVLFLFIVIAFPLNYLLVFFRNSGNALGLVFSALLLLFFVFFLAVAFYWLYPVVVLEKIGVFSALKRTVFLSGKNLKSIAVASVFPFAVSLINISLAFFYENPAFFALFVLMRFFTAVVYTYHLVLSPGLYLGTGKQEVS